MMNVPLNPEEPPMSQPITELYTDSEFFSPYAMSAFVVLTEKAFRSP